MRRTTLILVSAVALTLAFAIATAADFKPFVVVDACYGYMYPGGPELRVCKVLNARVNGYNLYRWIRYEDRDATQSLTAKDRVILTWSSREPV